MANVFEQSKEYGQIDLTHILKPILEFLEQPSNMEKFIVKPSNSKRPLFYIMTDKVISEVVKDEKRLSGLRREGRLFSHIATAEFISTLTKNTAVLQKQNAQLDELEELIYKHLQKNLQGQEAEFFSLTAQEYFCNFLNLVNKTQNLNKLAAPLSSAFSDTSFQDSYPEGKTLLRVPQHRLELEGNIQEEFLAHLEQRIHHRLKTQGDYDEEELTDKVSQMLRPDSGWLKEFLEVLETNIYGRIRRTYACCVLSQWVNDGYFNANSPAINYIKRVCDFNELVQNTLPGQTLAPNDFILEFPPIAGQGETFSFDVMTAFSKANAFDILPFWIDFNELQEESADSDKVISTMGQHFKLNGKVAKEGFNSVFEYNISKIQKVIAQLKTGEDLQEYKLKAALQVLVLYFVVFWDNDKEDNTVQNFQTLREGVNKLTQKPTTLKDVLSRILNNFTAPNLQQNVKNCGIEFRKLLSSRKLDNPPVAHIFDHFLYVLVSDELINDLKGLEKDEPIHEPPNYDYKTTYLRYVKVTRHINDNFNLLDKKFRITQSQSYITLPVSSNESRLIERDLSRQVLGILLMPKDKKLLYFSEFFKEFNGIVISYDRKQLYKPNNIDNSITEENTKATLADWFGLSVVRLIYVLLVYIVLKALARIELEYREKHELSLQHSERNLFLFFSLYSFALQKSKDGTEDNFTHDAHKAIEFLIRQYVPTKSQGFELKNVSQWDSLWEQWKKFEEENQNTDKQTILTEANRILKNELNNNYRFNNTLMGLFSGVDALWSLTEKPILEKIAILTVTSRRCDGLAKRAVEDRVVLFGEIHCFEYEHDNDKHYYRHVAPQSFCDEMNIENSFKNPSILFTMVDKLYQAGYRDILIVTKVPFQRRIRMTAKENSIYVNQAILKALAQQCPEARIYPLFTQKNWGVRLATHPQQPLFVPYKGSEKEQVTGSSHLFRIASVITYRVVQQKDEERLHSGIIDYLYLHYPELAPSQSRSLAALTQASQEQKCLFEAIRFLHTYPYEAAQGQQLNIKLDALENIIGDESVGTQAEVLLFPKPNKSERADAEIKWFKVNIIGMLSKKI